MPRSISARESLPGRIRRALRAIVLRRDRLIHVIGDSPFHPYATAEIGLNERELNRCVAALRRRLRVLAVLIAGVTGGLVYLAVLLLLVRPMRRITGSIAAFRADPERTHAARSRAKSRVLPNDEITVASRELAAMQHELRAALWRNAQAGRSRHGGRQGKPRSARHPDPGADDRRAAAAQPGSPRAARRRNAGPGCRPRDRPGPAHAGLCARGTAAAPIRPGRAGAPGQRGGRDREAAGAVCTYQQWDRRRRSWCGPTATSCSAC